MKSKFTKKAFVLPLVALSLIIISVHIIIDNCPIFFGNLRWIDFYMVILFTITIVWIVYFEVLRKTVFVVLKENTIKGTNVLGRTSEFSFDNLKGFKISINSTRVGNFEELQVIEGDKTVIILSEYYHENYQEMKRTIKGRLKYFGGAAKNYS